MLSSQASGTTVAVRRTSRASGHMPSRYRLLTPVSSVLVLGAALELEGQEREGVGDHEQDQRGERQQQGVLDAVPPLPVERRAAAGAAGGAALGQRPHVLHRAALVTGDQRHRTGGGVVHGQCLWHVSPETALLAALRATTGQSAARRAVGQRGASSGLSASSQSGGSSGFLPLRPEPDQHHHGERSGKANDRHPADLQIDGERPAGHRPGEDNQCPEQPAIARHRLVPGALAPPAGSHRACRVEASAGADAHCAWRNDGPCALVTGGGFHLPVRASLFGA